MAELAIIPISSLKPGIALSVPIYDATQTNLLLLNQGIRITQAFIDRLRSRGISYVAIDSSKLGQLSVDASAARVAGSNKVSSRFDIANSEVRKNKPHLERLVRHEHAAYDGQQVQNVREMRARHSQALDDVYERTSRHDTIPEQPMRAITEEAMEQLLNDMDLFVRMAMEVERNEAIVDHCLRVAQLSMSVATLMGLKFEDIANLGIGCLVSRIRLTENAHQKVHRDEELTNGGLLDFKKELRDNMYFIAPQKNLHIVARQVASQMFERWDGSGYPHGRTGVQISNLARLAMVVDCYLTLNSPDELDKSGLTPYQVIEKILKLTRSGQFDPQSIPPLLNTVCLYPLGSFVELNNQTYGQVIRVTPGNYDRPIVKAVCRIDGRHAEVPEHNLLKQTHIKVVKALNAKEIDEVRSNCSQDILRFSDSALQSDAELN